MNSKFCRTLTDFDTPKDFLGELKVLKFPVITEAPKLPKEDWEIIKEHGWAAWSKYKTSLAERKVDKRKYKKIEGFFCKGKEICSVWKHKTTGLYRVYDEEQKRWITDLSAIETCEKVAENETEA